MPSPPSPLLTIYQNKLIKNPITPSHLVPGHSHAHYLSDLFLKKSIREIEQPTLSHSANEEAGPEGYVIQPRSLSSLEAGTG